MADESSANPFPVDTPAAGDLAERPISNSEGGSRPSTLSGQQRALLRELERRNPALASMYGGGLRVLADTSNPDRFPLCAHAMRELMEKLPGLVDVSTKAQGEFLKVKVTEAKDAFKSMQRKTGCLNCDGSWEGAIDVHMRKFLGRIEAFFAWFEAHNPKRREEFRDTLLRLEGSGRELPSPLASLNVTAWESKRDYFQAISHHRKMAEEGEFKQWLDALERFLLDRLIPRTFDDFRHIDRLLEEEGTSA